MMPNMDDFNKALTLLDPDFDKDKTPYDLTVFELVNKIEHFSFTVLKKRGFKRGAYIKYRIYYYIKKVDKFGRIIKVGRDPMLPYYNIPFGVDFRIHKRQIVQKFRKEHWSQWLFEMFATNAQKSNSNPALAGLRDRDSALKDLGVNVTPLVSKESTVNLYWIKYEICT